MIKLTSLKIPVKHNDFVILSEAARALNIKKDDILSFKILKKSIDARHGSVSYILSLSLEVRDENQAVKNCKNAVVFNEKRYLFPAVRTEGFLKPTAIVGFGPAGMFCALFLCRCNIPVVVFERGSAVEKRVVDVEKFKLCGCLDTESNVQFGEGGAGTFSDGKLHTGINDGRVFAVLEEFVSHGAPKSILFDAKPHIGTDILRGIVKNIRNEIISLGGEIRFNTKVTEIIRQNGAVTGLGFTDENGFHTQSFSAVVFAVGHSSRDTAEMLVKSGIYAEQKPFSVGVRIEHPREMIDRALYGRYAEFLPSAPYKLTARGKNGRGVYTFCMCPGGEVIAAASEKNSVVTNGMSQSGRDGKNSNSALLVGVNPADFGSESVTAGIELQRKIERSAFYLGGGGYKAPVQLAGDFLKNQKSAVLGDVEPTYKPGYSFEKLDGCLPDFVCGGLREALPLFEKKINGFSRYDAVLTGAETRSSSPVRFVRNDVMQSVSADGLYPIGEGAGYAGGITSSAVDGIKCAEIIALKYKKHGNSTTKH